MKKSLKIIFISIFAALTGIALVSCKHKNKDKAGNNQENTQQNNQDQKQDGKGNQTTPVEPTPAPQKDQAENQNGKENEEGKGSQTSPVVPNPAPQDGNKEQSQADQPEKQQNHPETKKEVTGIDISKMYYHKLWESKFNELKEEILAHDITDFDKKYLFVLISRAIKNIKEEKQTFDQAYKEVYKQLVKKVVENSKKQNNQKKENEELQADQASSEETTNNGKQTVPSTNPSEEPKLNGEHETTNQAGDADATVVQPNPGTTTDGSTSETSPGENTAGKVESSPKEPSEEKQNDEAVEAPSNGSSSTPSSGESSTTSPSPSNTEVSTPAENEKEEEKFLLDAPIKENWDKSTGYITYTFKTSKETYEHYKNKELVLKITNPTVELGDIENADIFDAAVYDVQGKNTKTNLNPIKKDTKEITFEISSKYYFRKETAPESKYTLEGIYEKGKRDNNILKNKSNGVDIKYL